MRSKTNSTEHGNVYLGYGGGDFYDNFEEDEDYSWNDGGFGNGAGRFRGRGGGKVSRILMGHHILVILLLGRFVFNNALSNVS